MLARWKCRRRRNSGIKMLSWRSDWGFLHNHGEGLEGGGTAELALVFVAADFPPLCGVRESLAVS